MLPVVRIVLLPTYVLCSGLYANMNLRLSSINIQAHAQTPPGCVDDDAVSRANRN
jgi:hypothetical protein